MALPPIIPAPKSNAGQAAQRASEQQKAAAYAYRGPAPAAPAPALPPILHASAPPASSYRSQAAAYAYRPPPNAKYSSAGLPPAPTPAASPAAQKNVVTGQVIAAWFALRSKGFFPATAVPPVIKFDTHETPGVGAYVTHVGSGPREFHIPPSLTKMLASPTDAASSDWARAAIMHELAHTAQNAAAGRSTTMAEGGATAFAENATPKVYGTVAPLSTGRYGQWLNQVGLEPPNWVTHGQFTPGAQPPTVNMPGTPAYGGAMNKVADSADVAAQLAGRAATPNMQQLAAGLATSRFSPFGLPMKSRRKGGTA